MWSFVNSIIFASIYISPFSNISVFIDSQNMSFENQDNANDVNDDVDEDRHNFEETLAESNEHEWMSSYWYV